MQDETKKCPYCDEIIQNTDKYCRHCGKEISSTGNGSDFAGRLSTISNTVVDLIKEQVHFLPKDSWQIKPSVKGSILYFNLWIDYDLLNKEVFILADSALWIEMVAKKVGEVSARSGYQLIRDNNMPELQRLSESTLVIEINDENQKDRNFKMSCKVKELFKVLKSNERHVLSIMQPLFD